MERKKKSPSWAAIIIWFILFWPVSIYLIWKKLTTDKAAAMQNSKVLKAIGIIFVVIGVLMLATIGEDDTGSVLLLFIFYTGGGALIIWGSNKVKQSGEMYKKYIAIVINQNETTIENIASITGLSYDETVKGLQKMIDLEYFEGAYIDHANHEIVFPKKQQMVANESMQNSAFANSQSQQKTVKCPNCGGNNLITVGGVGECDFCGSPLQG